MKVIIQQRSVYHKFAEIEIKIDKNELEHFKRKNENYDIDDYLLENEDLYVDKIEEEISKAEFEYGFGCEDTGMDEKDSESEWRYEVVETNYGGHL